MTQDQGQKVGEWGPWIEHDGSRCPVPLGYIVEAFAEVPCGCSSQSIIFLIDRETKGMPEWVGSPGCCTVCDKSGVLVIFRYRIRKPRALLQMIERAADLPASVRPQKVDV